MTAYIIDKQDDMYSKINRRATFAERSIKNNGAACRLSL